MRQNGRQRSRKSEAIGQHVFRAGLAEFLPEPIVAVQDLADDRLRTRSVHVALFHRRSGRKPAARIHVALDPRIIGGKVLLHETISVGAAEIENVVRIFVEQLEIILHGLADVFADDLGIFPSPLSVQVSVADHIKCRLLGQIGLFDGLGANRADRDQASQWDCRQSRPVS